MQNYVDFAVEKACELIFIDSPSGFTAKAAEWVKNEFEELGFKAEYTRKGGVIVDLGGEDENDALLLEAHADTLGAMVAEIKEDGRLKITNIGGLRAENSEAENVRVYDYGRQISAADLGRGTILRGEIAYARTNWAGDVDLLVIGGGQSGTICYGGQRSRRWRMRITK